MARTFVQSMTVGILCATVTTVQSSNSVLIIFWRLASVVLSTEAVASSRISIFLLLSNARPKQHNCRCPMLQFEPSCRTVIKAKKTLLYILQPSTIPISAVLQSRVMQTYPYDNNGCF